MILSFVGGFALRNNIGDVVVVGVFGLVGYAMIRYEISRVAFIIGLILGPLVESNFLRSLLLSRGDYAIFYSRTISKLLIIGLVLSFGLPYLRKLRRSYVEAG